MATVGLVIASGVLVLGGALALGTSAVMGFAAVLKIWTAAQWLLNFAMDANPIGLLIVGAALAAAGAYLVIRNWGAVTDFFRKWGPEVLEFLLFPFVKIPLEIYRHIDAIKNAAKSVAQAIAGFFVGHSPIPQGPLRDLDMSRTISQTFRPSQVMTAARAAAAAIALSVPLAISPAAASMPMPARGGAMVSVVLNNTFNFSGVAADDEPKIRKMVDDQIQKSGYQLAEVLNREFTRRRRTDF